MTDITTYTRDSAPLWAELVVAAIREGDMAAARALYADAAARVGHDRVVFAVAAPVEPGPGEITVGDMPLLYGNPHRTGYGWRCGVCLHRFRHGGPDPRSGVNYKTRSSADTAARKHAAEDHQAAPRLVEVTR